MCGRAGRPLTEETKKKLGIARTDQQQTAKAFGGNWAKEGLETSVGDKNSQDRRQSGAKDDKEALTMIGDCVVSSEAPLIERKANKPKTKRKRKFKNV